MKVTNTQQCELTTGGVTIAPGESAEVPGLTKEDIFVKAGWLVPVGSPKAAKGSKAPSNTPAPVSLLGSNVLPAEIEIAEGNVIALGDLVRAAFDDSEFTTPEEWNAQSGEEIEELLAEKLEAMKAEAAGGAGDDAEFTVKHKGGPKFIILDPQGKEVPGVSGTKEEMTAKAKELTDALNEE
jgi:hypothetical protein